MARTSGMIETAHGTAPDEARLDAAEAAGAIFEGRKHDALADARGVAAGFVAMIGKGAPNPFLESGRSP